MRPTQKVLIFFDQDCGLCDRLTFWLIKQAIEHNLPFLFSPLGGQSYQSWFPAKPTSIPWQSILVIPQGTSPQKVLEKSSAVFYIASYLPWPWRGCFYLSYLIPKRLADYLYDWVAKNRQKWFGQPTQCQQLPVELKSRFLAD